MNELQEKAKELRREYYREWRRKNKDKVRQHQENYWKKKAKKELEQGGGNDEK